ncbi:MAG: AGE family epimerase/isomerase, partial [Sphingomonadaceae bacterium]|nr:AGE family epimerase/isomerase [Sphingomonadaceae bacterium]
TDGGARYADYARRLLSLFESRFIDPATGVLREYFGPNWEVDDRFGSERLEPGHMCEWVWLLRRHERLSGVTHDARCAALLGHARALSGEAPSHTLVDEVTIDGVALKDSQRLWPQVELLKALIVQARATGRRPLLDDARALVQQLFRSFLTGAPDGCWRDRFTLDGTFIADSIPGSSLYHLWTAVAELLDDGAAIPAPGRAGAKGTA